jgi:hypothetical protein
MQRGIQGGCRTPPANIFKCDMSKTQAFFSITHIEIGCGAMRSSIKKMKISTCEIHEIGQIARCATSRERGFDIPIHVRSEDR